jgi:glycosyltransferase involved in cell wall biosynthesis
VRSISLVVPGPLDQRTGGYIYDRRMVEGLRSDRWCVDVIELPDDFPHPAPATLEHASRAFERMPDGAIVVTDSLAFGAMPDLIERESPRLHIVALMHLPLATAARLEGRSMEGVMEAERRALHCAARIIVTGKAALPLLAEYAPPFDRVIVVEPGTDRVPLARGSRHASEPNAPLELLCVASLNAIKGHEMLLEALAATPHEGWRLTCAGSLTRDPGTVARVRTAITRLGLEDRVSLAGELHDDALESCFDRADVFVLAARQETYGMAVAEALARGIPVVATRTGAIAELVDHEAGLVVAVDDRAALASALGCVMLDGDLRARLAEGARRVRSRLRTWEDAAERMSAVLDPLTYG